MKILLTGKPRSGKTTLLTALLAHTKDRCGLTAVEVREHGARIGFDAITSNSDAAALARIDKPTNYPVGRYYVDIASLEALLKPLFGFTPGQFLYIDEIGQMQLYSPVFRRLIEEYLSAPNHFLGTITSVYNDLFVSKVKGRRDILLCEVTPKNRHMLEQNLAFAVKNRDLTIRLSAAAQQALITTAAEYLRKGDYIRVKKLFKNALPYAAEGRVTYEKDGFLVEGNTRRHHITAKQADELACDCDLYNGQGQFAGRAGDCSHIQAVKLFKLA